MSDLEPNPGVTRNVGTCERAGFLRKVIFACGKSSYAAVLRVVEAIRAFPFVVEMTSPFLGIG